MASHKRVVYPNPDPSVVSKFQNDIINRWDVPPLKDHGWTTGTSLPVCRIVIRATFRYAKFHYSMKTSIFIKKKLYNGNFGSRQWERLRHFADKVSKLKEESNYHTTNNNRIPTPLWNYASIDSDWKDLTKSIQTKLFVCPSLIAKDATDRYIFCKK